MGIRECLEQVLSGYAQASAEAFAKHPLATFIRGEFRKTVESVLGREERLVFKGSAGQGNWAKGPWFGIFDRIVTTGAQSGYYPAYLFREDMAGVYLSLNQGMTEAKQHYKSAYLSATCSRAR